MELREWQKPLSEEKVAWLAAQFAQLEYLYGNGGYSPTLGRSAIRNFWER